MDQDKYIGRLLDNRYEIQEVIGVGGMAVVYKARCHRLNRLVAIKILKDEHARDEEFRRRFHAESQAVAMLSHPNIVSVYDVASTGDAHYIVMELIDGITLKQYMEKKGVLNWKETLHFAIQIGKALEHAHSRGIVHRDIKPHNVMVLKNGSVKVTDFGIARVMSKSNTLTKEALGSVHYISPEQAKGGRVDNRSDIYSLGVVMYEMITGRPPYDGESPVSVAIQHINGGAKMPSTLNPNIPGGLEQIIMKAMAHDPNNRYNTATAMLYDMDEFRKNPIMLFDYNGVNPEALTRPPLVIKTPEVTPPKTTAERVAAGKAESAAGRTAAAGRAATRAGERTASRSTGRTGTRQAPARRQRAEAEQEERRNRIATIAVVCGSIVAIIAIGIFLWAFLNGDFFTTPKEQLVSVPGLVGEDYNVVKNTKYEFFTIVLEDYEYSDKPAGYILSQEPLGGDQVVKGTKITVVVSQGPEPEDKIMIDLVNLDRQNAVDYLVGQGIPENLILIREEYSKEITMGKVIRTDPAENAVLVEGQPVTIWVSRGQEIVKARMPNVVDWLFEDAEKELNKLGFMDVTAEEVESNEPRGTVLKQSATRYLEYDVTTPIVLEVSKGPAQKVMPSVLGKTYDDAYKQLTDLGFLYVYKETQQSNEPEGTVLEQSVSENTLIDITTTIVLQVSEGPKSVKMPDLAEKTFDEAVKILQDMGFVGEISRVDVDNDAPEGQVVGQSVEKNTEVTVITDIVLQISKGPVAPEQTKKPVEVDLSDLFVGEDGKPLPEPLAPYRFEVKDDTGQTVMFIDGCTTHKLTVELEGFGLLSFEIHIDGVFYKYLTVDFRSND